MKKLIINADDFGLSGDINQGIIQAHASGILTSATLMANMPGFDQAVSLAKENPELGVGIHLNLVRGYAVSPEEKVGSLLSPQGCFWSNVYIILSRMARNKISLNEVEVELRAQIEKVLKTGIRPSHLDSEKHIHTVRPVFKIVLRLAKEYNIGCVRFIREYCISPQVFQMVKSVFITLSCVSMAKRMSREGVKTSDHFVGVCASGRMTAPRIHSVLGKLKDGSTELMVHPGFITEEMVELEKEFGAYYINKYREQELEALMDKNLKKTIAENNIHLINFNQL